MQRTCPFDATNLGEVKDLGLVIDYNTPGITAIPMNDPGFLSRDKGLETMADPSAVLLDDSTIALYFTGDIGAHITEQLYQAVAIVLAYLYRLDKGEMVEEPEIVVPDELQFTENGQVIDGKKPPTGGSYA